MTDLAFTFSEGQIVRLDRVPHKIIRIHLVDHTVTLVGPRGLRTVSSDRLKPARRGDTVVTLSSPGFTRRGGR